MNVLLDIHHHDLFRSLYLLFRGRLGFNVYLPYGLEWHSEHKYANYPSMDTVGQYLLGAKHWVNAGGDLPDVQFLTLEEFKDIRIDITVASLMENASVFADLNRIYGKNAKEIIQVGNNFPVGIIDPIGKNLMSSSTVVYELSQIPHKIFYHQEFDLNYFHPPEEQKDPKRIYSLQPYFETGGHPFQIDYPIFQSMTKKLNGFDCQCYGAGSQNGPITGVPQVMSKVFQEAGFIFHVKPQGDGYGHIYHNAFACGKPVIYKSEYLFYNDLKMTPMQLFTEETTVDLSRYDIDCSVEKIKDMAAAYPEVSNVVLERFKQVVNFDMEFEDLKVFIGDLR
jgi:hypothetical protein